MSEVGVSATRTAGADSRTCGVGSSACSDDDATPPTGVGVEVAASTTPATGDAEAEVLSVTSFKTYLGPQSALKKVRQLPDPRKG